MIRIEIRRGLRSVVLALAIASPAARAQPWVQGAVAGATAGLGNAASASMRWGTPLIPSGSYVLDTTFSWAAVDTTMARLGWSRIGARWGTECWEHRDLGLSIWTACPVLILSVDPVGHLRLSDREFGVERQIRVPPHVVVGKLLFDVEERNSSGGATTSPSLSGFLMQAWWQQRDSVAASRGIEFVEPLARDRLGLLSRLALSSRWSMDYLEEDNSFVLDGPLEKRLGHFLGWFFDVLAWGAVIGPQFNPELEPGERAILAAATLGAGIGVRVAILGWPMSAELEFRNAMANGPYRWPKSMVPGRE